MSLLSLSYKAKVQCLAFWIGLSWNITFRFIHFSENGIKLIQSLMKDISIDTLSTSCLEFVEQCWPPFVFILKYDVTFIGLKTDSENTLTSIGGLVSIKLVSIWNVSKSVYLNLNILRIFPSVVFFFSFLNIVVESRRSFSLPHFPASETCLQLHKPNSNVFPKAAVVLKLKNRLRRKHLWTYFVKWDFLFPHRPGGLVAAFACCKKRNVHKHYNQGAVLVYPDVHS